MTSESPKPLPTWFVLDLGNVVVELDYERVLREICSDAASTPEEVAQLLEGEGGYRDMERGACSFADLHALLCSRAGYRASIDRLREVWSDFFKGPMNGIEEVLRILRRHYRIAFLSNSNEVHAEVIPRVYGELFEKDDRFVFSHLLKTAKPDPAIFTKTLQILGVNGEDCVYVDDLEANVVAARAAGMIAFHFSGARELLEALEREGLLPETADR